jgi:hypothetical protein
MRTYLALGLAIVATCASARQTAPQSKNETSLRGNEYAFSISLPEKWNLDTTKRALQHLARAVLYTTTFGSREVKIEVLPATKRIEGNNTFRNLLGYSAHFDSTSGARHIENPAIETKDGKKVPIITSAYTDWQTVNAYIEEANAVIVFSLVVLDLKSQKEGMDALTAVVRSYSSLPVENAPKK